MIHILSDRGGFGAFAALLVLKIGEMVWNYFRQKEKITADSLAELKMALAKNTDMTTHLSMDIAKLKLDLQRCFFALKHITGDEWDEIVAKIKSKESD